MSFSVPTDATSRTQWLQQMQSENGERLDLSRAAALGVPADVATALRRADINGDGNLSWPDVWAALQSTRRSTEPTALATPQGQRGVAANGRTSGAESVSYGGQTFRFPAGALREPPRVQSDGVHLRFSDGTDAVVAKEGERWNITMDRLIYHPKLPPGATIELRPMAADRPNEGFARGHAVELRAAGGAWSVLATPNVRVHALTDDPIITPSNFAPVTAPGASRVEVTTMRTSDERYTRLSLTYPDGSRAHLDLHHDRYVLVVGDERRVIMREGNEIPRELRLERPGTLTIASENPTLLAAKSGNGLTPGPIVRRYEPARAEPTEIDLQTAPARTARVNESIAAIRGGDAAATSTLASAYAAKLHSDFSMITGPVHDRDMSRAFGRDAGAAIAELARTSPSAARAAQARFLAEVSDGATPFGAEALSAVAVDAYFRALLDEPSALPLLEATVAIHPRPFSLSLTRAGHTELNRAIDARLAANDLDGARRLGLFGARTRSDEPTPLITGGTRSDTAYTLSAPDGTRIPLRGQSDPAEVRAFRGLETAPGAVAHTRAHQIAFSAAFRANVAALPEAARAQFNASELAAVPPTPEVMQRYFAARYGGRMPAAMNELQNELGDYMRCAFVHPGLGVPNDLEVWNSRQLPHAADGRLIGDCVVMNRAVVHMLSGVPGLRMRAAIADGHSRLVVTTPDGQKGFVQSNDAFFALPARPPALLARVMSTIERHSELQVLFGMPAPLRLGGELSTDDPSLAAEADARFKASRGDAHQALDALTGTQRRLRKTGNDVRPLIHRFGAFRADADAFFLKWSATPVQERAALDGERETLNRRYLGLMREVQALPRDPSAMAAFVRDLKTEGRMFNVGSGRDFLAGEQRTRGAPVGHVMSEGHGIFHL
ncbi:MAG: hypothetical protein IT381_04260 [Deltaproteobacteria bacterium]|nr:hypothetical protein [Deltaproteobacteria bacterium]